MKKKILFIAVILAFIGLAFFLNKNIIEKFDYDFSNSFSNIKGNYPKDLNDKNEVMKNDVISSANEVKEIWKVGGEFYNQMQALRKENPEMPEIHPEFMTDYSTSTSKILSINNYLISKYIFEGGANGLNLLSAYSFSKNGQVKLEDILNVGSGNDISLSKMLQEKLIITLGQNADKDTISEGLGLSYLTPQGKLDKVKCACESYNFGTNLSVFEVLDEGMKFTFQQYQVGPRTLGTPSVLLTWSELDKFLNPNFKINLSK
jgi:hypothetical protein